MFDIYIKNYKTSSGSVNDTETLLMSIPMSNPETVGIINPTVKQDMGTVGTMDFEVQPDSEWFDSFMQIRTVIRVVYDGDTIFYGRVLTVSDSMWGSRKVTCEDAYSFLNDVIYPGKEKKEEKKIKLEDYVEKVIEYFNAHVNFENDHPSIKKVILGEYPEHYSENIADDQKIPSVEKKLETTTWKSVKSILDELASNYGGYWRTRYKNGNIYLDWLNCYFNPIVNSSVIRVGKNIIDINSSLEANNIFTAVIPLGRKNGKSNNGILTIDNYKKEYHKGNFITVSDLVNIYQDAGKINELNRGYHSVEDYSTGVDKYGMIYKVQDFSNADSAEELWKYATEWLRDNYLGILKEYTIKLVEMHQIGEGDQKYLVGDRVIIDYDKMTGDVSVGELVSNSEYGPIEYSDADVLTIKSIIYDLFNPENTQLTVGYPSDMLDHEYGNEDKATKTTSTPKPPSKGPGGDDGKHINIHYEIRKYVSSEKMARYSDTAVFFGDGGSTPFNTYQKYTSRAGKLSGFTFLDSITGDYFSDPIGIASFRSSSTASVNPSSIFHVGVCEHGIFIARVAQARFVFDIWVDHTSSGVLNYLGCTWDLTTDEGFQQFLDDAWAGNIVKIGTETEQDPETGEPEPVDVQIGVDPKTGVPTVVATPEEQKVKVGYFVDEKSGEGGWNIYLNDKVTYKDKDDKEHTISGVVSVKDLKLREIDSFYTKIMEVDTMVVNHDAFIKNLRANKIVADTYIRSAYMYSYDVYASRFHGGHYIYSYDTGSQSQSVQTKYLEDCFSYFTISQENGIATFSFYPLDTRKEAVTQTFEIGSSFVNIDATGYIHADSYIHSDVNVIGQAFVGEGIHVKDANGNLRPGSSGSLPSDTSADTASILAQGWATFSTITVEYPSVYSSNGNSRSENTIVIRTRRGGDNTFSVTEGGAVTGYSFTGFSICEAGTTEEGGQYAAYLGTAIQSIDDVRYGMSGSDAEGGNDVEEGYIDYTNGKGEQQTLIFAPKTDFQSISVRTLHVKSGNAENTDRLTIDQNGNIISDGYLDISGDITGSNITGAVFKGTSLYGTSLTIGPVGGSGAYTQNAVINSSGDITGHTFSANGSISAVGDITTDSGTVKGAVVRQQGTNNNGDRYNTTLGQAIVSFQETTYSGDTGTLHFTKGDGTTGTVTFRKAASATITESRWNGTNGQIKLSTDNSWITIFDNVAIEESNDPENATGQERCTLTLDSGSDIYGTVTPYLWGVRNHGNDAGETEVFLSNSLRVNAKPAYDRGKTDGIDIGKGYMGVSKGSWSGGQITFTATDQSSGTVTPSKTIQLARTVSSWSNKKATVTIWDGSTNVQQGGLNTGYTFEVNASSVYTAGYNSAGVAIGNWSSGQISFSKNTSSTTTQTIKLTTSVAWSTNSVTITVNSTNNGTTVSTNCTRTIDETVLFAIGTGKITAYVKGHQNETKTVQGIYINLPPTDYNVTKKWFTVRTTSKSGANNDYGTVIAKTRFWLEQSGTYSETMTVYNGPASSSTRPDDASVVTSFKLSQPITLSKNTTRVQVQQAGSNWSTAGKTQLGAISKAALIVNAYAAFTVTINGTNYKCYMAINA